jgi:hypothetical protein
MVITTHNVFIIIIIVVVVVIGCCLACGIPSSSSGGGGGGEVRTRAGDVDCTPWTCRSVLLLLSLLSLGTLLCVTHRQRRAATINDQYFLTRGADVTVFVVIMIVLDEAVREIITCTNDWYYYIINLTRGHGFDLWL